MREPQKILQATRNGLTKLISGAIIGKLLNFICNTIIINSIGNKVLGTGSLRLDELLFMGPLVLTREGLRRAAYKININSKDSDINAKQSLINLTWFVAPITVVVALVFAYINSAPAEIVCCDDTMLLARTERNIIYVLFGWSKCRDVTCEDTNVSISSYYRAMLYTFLAVLLAVLTEPVYVLAQSKLLTDLRANIETCAVLFKCLAMLYLTVGLGMDVEAYAIANIIYASISLCGYWGYMVYHKKFPRPKPFTTSSSTTQWCTPAIQDTATVFWWQSIQKWLLENGAKGVLLWLGTATEQGGYVIVSNLGSIVVRLLFQPVEEMSMAALGKLTSTTNKEKEKEKENEKNITDMVHRNFSGWLLLLVLIGLMFACFGPCYSHLFPKYNKISTTPTSHSLVLFFRPRNFVLLPRVVARPRRNFENLSLPNRNTETESRSILSRLHCSVPQRHCQKSTSVATSCSRSTHRQWRPTPCPRWSCC